MKSVLLIGLSADKPSTRLRMAPLAEHLRQRGYEVTLCDLPRSSVGRVGLLRLASRQDVVVLQKKLFPTVYVELLRLANKRLVFDVDDAVMFHELERGQALTGKYFQRFAAIAAASRLVVAGNTYVAEFAQAARVRGNAEVVVLPTPIDVYSLTARPAPGAGDVVIGWIGTKGNLHQLVPLADAFRRLQEALPVMTLRLVTDGTMEIPGVHVETKAWSATEETADLHGFDIGIMPLEDNLWNRGKGGFKLLQYMAAGLPAVASPVGINAEIVQHGHNGFLARNTDEWAECLLKLARDPVLRQLIGQAARQTIEQEYSLDVYLERYVALIESCLQ